ncbi:MAG: PAS domain-containing protein [Armatimonadetes bacterium]|nr:PAS domain-containing protein [Armatimonadota bacterium]
MIVAILANLSHDWVRMVRSRLGEDATILEADSFQGAIDLLQAVPANLVVLDWPAISDERISALVDIRATVPEAVILGLAPSEVIDRVRDEELPAPDLWIDTDRGGREWDHVVTQAMETARLRADQVDLEDADEGRELRASNEQSSPELAVLHRLMSGVAGGFDLQRLLEAYTDAVAQYTRCAGFCLLWEDENEECYSVRLHRGIRPEIVAGGRLLPGDALPAWYRRNRRILSVSQLHEWPDRPAAIRVKREMELFSGRVAIPLVVRGRLAGVFILGDKVLGESYSTGELETLFAISNYAALAAEGIELHEELRRAKSYTDRIVKSMSAGLLSLGLDERINVCSPYAAEVLGLSLEDVEGADLRCLPSPLGDYLYAALQSEDRTVSGEEVNIRGGEVALRVSTSSLLDDDGNILGSVLLLDDITTEKELATERSRRERLDVLTRIVERLAHEVKNPLTAVKTYAELIGDRGPDEQLAQFWSRTVLPEIDHLDELLKNLLRMVEQPEPQLQWSAVDELINAAVERLPLPEDLRRQAIEIDVPTGLPPIMVDASATTDALSYLLRYVAGSRPHPVRVQARHESSEGDEVLSVTIMRTTQENGSFEPEHVFDPLFAMQHPEADLGPVISQRIITNQRGRVEALEDQGRVTMRVVLPASSRADAVSPSEVN